MKIAVMGEQVADSSLPLGPIRDGHRLEVASERYTDVSLREASEGRVFEQKCVVGDAHDLLRRFQSP
jgi:hypothetical protein